MEIQMGGGGGGGFELGNPGGGGAEAGLDIQGGGGGGGGGGGSLNLEILRGGGLKQFWISRWMGGVKKLCLPSWGCGFFLE